MFLALAETDAGGFADFLKKLYEAIKAEAQVILTAAGAAAGAAIGAAIGGSVGTAVAGPVGALIGVVAGLVLGLLVGFLVSLFGDEIFAPFACTMTLPDATATWAGATASPSGVAYFTDFGGRYDATYDWELVQA